MSDNLTVFGVDYTNVAGIKAHATSDSSLMAYIRPQGTKSIAANGTGIDVTEYASVDVAVPAQDNSLVVTLSWDDDYFGADDGAWVPDCTIYDLQDAYAGGKEIAFVSENGEPASWFYDDDYSYLYSVLTDGSQPNSLLIREYWFTTQGIVHTGDTEGVFPNFDSPTRTYTPTTSQQTETITYDQNDGYNGIEQVSVTVNAMPTGTAGTPTAAKGVVSNHSVSVTPSVTNMTGYITGGTVSGTAVSVTASELVSGTYTVTGSGTANVTNYASASVASGELVDSIEYLDDDPSVSVDSSTGIVRVSGGFSADISPISTSGWVDSSQSIPCEIGVSGTYQLSTQAAATITPSTSSQTAVAAGKYTTGAVTVAAMPSGSVSASASKGSVSNHSVSVTPTATVNTAGYLAAGSTSGTAVTVSASELVSGNYSPSTYGVYDVTNYETCTVAGGSEGTPTATKSAVSNHSVSVTPSVTNIRGFITGSTKTGTAVTVSASELVSGSQTVTENDTYDVTNLAELVVNVSGGGSSSMQVGTKTATLSAAASSISFTGLNGNPLAFVVTSSTGQSTGGTTAVAVAYDGTSLHGMDVTTQAEADTGYTKAYSGGTLTVTATTATFEANEYKLVYAYGGSSSDIHTADVQVGSGATSITFTGLSGRPLYFSCVFKSSFSTSSGYQRVIDVVNDGTSTYGHAFDSSAKAQTSWSYTYSGGSLTISSTGTNDGGYFHQPGYYGLVYAVDPNALSYQNKTGVGATTSSQTIYADAGYDALESVQIDAISQTNLTAANIKNGTTVTISNGTTNLWSVTGTYTGGGGGSASVETTTWSNSSNTTTSHQFTNLKGTPKAAFLRCTSSLSRSSSSTNYFIADMVWDGTSCKGNSFRRSNGTYANVTSGYTVTTGSNSITFTSSGTSTTNPGSFYNGSYELLYVY